MLLAEALWPRRADAAAVMGAGLEIAALGMGHRQITARLGLAEGTVRGWLRTFARRAEAVRRHFTVALVALADDPVMLDAAASPFADAVSAAATKRPQMLTVLRWEFAGGAIGGRLLTSSTSVS